MINGFQWPVYSQDEIDLVCDVLSSGKVNYLSGSIGKIFEQEFAVFNNITYASSHSSGTMALEIALKSLDVKNGDEVIVPAASFISTASSVVAAGGIPVFADVCFENQTISLDSIRENITNKTKGIICVHLGGMPCELDGIVSIAKERKIFLIEDCSQAHGAEYKNKKVGSFGDLAVWSFCTDKIISTGGEGGMICTDSANLHDRVTAFRNHGRSDLINDMDSAVGFKWMVNLFGTNSRLTEMQSAIGLSQLRRLPKMLDLRDQNAKKIRSVAKRFDIFRIPEVPDYAKHAWYKCIFYVNQDQLLANWSRDRIVEEVIARGVPCFTGGCPEIYLEKAFASASLEPLKRLSAARTLGENSVMFLVHPTLSYKELEKTCQVIEEVAFEASVDNFKL